ncbi:hypothetical protein HYS94_02985 [Candidatus Daviesbacteria bacterium]|nr:hypothetical protein [Candidatus Daviesbacteria bacterium]MBI4036140.1 hypothetical protein [Candidatus Daviesbacteria bacterium]
MKKQFYTHLVEIESIIVELDKMDLSEEEKMHLASLVDSSLHHTILDAILSELSEDDKKIFLRHVHEDDHQKIWQFLNEKTNNIEEKIKKAADDLKIELHKDIKRAKQEKG